MAVETRSFTIRVPLETYFELSRLATNDNENLNSKVNHVIQLGLGKHISLTQALNRLLRNAVVDRESGDE